MWATLGNVSADVRQQRFYNVRRRYCAALVRVVEVCDGIESGLAIMGWRARLARRARITTGSLVAGLRDGYYGRIEPWVVASNLLAASE
jgi:hypothetical protein